MNVLKPRNITNFLCACRRPRGPLHGAIAAASLRRALTPAVLLLMLFAILFPTGQLQAAVDRMALNGGETLPAPAAPAPATPSSVTVTRSDGSLHASWPAVDGAASYHVTYSSDGAASWSLAALNHPNASIAIGGADNAKDLHRRRPRPQRQRRQRLDQLRPRRPLHPADANANPRTDSHADAGTDAYPYPRTHADADARIRRRTVGRRRGAEQPE